LISTFVDILVKLTNTEVSDAKIQIDF